MRTVIEIPTTHLDILRSTLDAIRGETYVLKAAGLLSVSADDLLDGGGTVQHWIRDLAECELAEREGWTLLPIRDPGTLQHIVYALSSVLVWADELRTDGRMASVIPAEALAAWGEVEHVAGLSGRTARALGAPLTRSYVDLVIQAAGDLAATEAAAAAEGLVTMASHAA